LQWKSTVGTAILLFKGGWNLQEKRQFGMTVKVIKRPGPLLQTRLGQIGGNRKPQTFKTCEHCGKEFGPVSHLKKRFCGYSCKVAAQTTGRKITRKTIAKARTAQSQLRNHVITGRIIRPNTCEQCGKQNCRIEAAHYDYEYPLVVRWLCVSCHRKWDKEFPKGVTYTVAINEGRGEKSG